MEQTSLETPEEVAQALGISGQLDFIGVEGHWRVFLVKGSFTEFVYVSLRPELVYNCLYEV